MKGKVLEIFRSVQGEGRYAGVNQVFVRFFECNMHCVWCDTPHSIGDGQRRYDEYSAGELFDQIRSLWKDCHSVSLTGGEPLMQTEFIKELIPHLKKAGMPIYLETNGIFYDELKEVIDDIDIIAMDIKLPSSTQCKSFWKEHEEFLKVALKKDIFIKTVISSDTLAEDVERSVDLVSGLSRDVFFILQPNSFEVKNGAMSKCLEFQNYCFQHLHNVRILPQLHKIMKVR